MIKNINKKGSIIDLAFLIVLAIGFSTFLIITGYVFYNIYTQLGQTVIADDPNVSTVLNFSQSLLLRYDYLFVMIFFGFGLSLLISAYFIDSSPIFIMIYILIMALLVMIAAVGEHFYEKISIIPEFASIVTDKPMMNYIMENLIIVSIGFGVLSMVLIFAKPRGGDRF